MSIVALITLCFRLFAIRSNKTIQAGSANVPEQQLGQFIVSDIISSNFICKGRVLLFLTARLSCQLSTVDDVMLLLFAAVSCRFCRYAGLAVPPMITYAPSSQFTDLWACSPISTACCLQHWDLVLTWLFVRYQAPPGIGFFFSLKIKRVYVLHCCLTPRRSRLQILIPDWQLQNLHRDNSEDSFTSALCETSDRRFGSPSCCFLRGLLA